MAARLIFVESDTKGAAMPALATAARLGLEPVLLTGRPQRYTGLADTGAEVVECDTNSLEALVDVTSRWRRDIAGVTTTSEYHLLAVAELARYLGLPGNPPAAVRLCRNKAGMRGALAAAEIGQPRYAALRDHRRLATTLREVGLPCVVKPVDQSGSRDVRLCRSEPQVRAHLRQILSDTRSAGVALVEEYLDGPEYSLEMFSTAGVARCVGITAKSVTGDPYFVEAGHRYPAGLDPDVSRMLITTVRRALGAVGVREGPTHTEVKLLTDRAAVVEINIRLAGGLIPELIKLVDGIDLLEQQIRAAVGRPVDLARVPGPDKVAEIRFITVDTAGTVLDVAGVDQASAVPGVRAVSVPLLPGAEVGPPRDAGDRVGHVIAGGADREYVTASLNRATSLIRIALVPDEDAADLTSH
ncbi:MAG TPA: ATP-grasp domain-containing protein [Pseudonocardiaceae bacterium]|jgi:cysteine synthase A